MALLVPAIVLLVLLAGCGAGDERPAQKTRRQDSAPRTATTPASQTATSEVAPPATANSQPTATVPAPTTAGPWTNCGRILSPVDRRPQRVEARVFDCRAARRVAVRYLRDGSLPQGWVPADCAASRAACEQGGWAFRVVQK